jgi:hypothetical protein
LTTLYLVGTKVTDSAVKEFRRAHPDCKVYH